MLGQNSINDVNHLTPAYTSLGKRQKTKKRKHDKSETAVEDLPMEERLTNLTMNGIDETVPTATTGESLSQLLSQALHSKNKELLQTVLLKDDDKIIDNTLKRIPIQLIVPFISELKDAMLDRGQIYVSYIKWLRSTIQVHSSYLMSCPDIEDLLMPLYAFIHTERSLFGNISLLKGKVDLVVGQIISSEEESKEISRDALVTYQEESSDEDSDVMDDLLLHSESEINWDELSNSD